MVRERSLSLVSSLTPSVIARGIFDLACKLPKIRDARTVFVKLAAVLVEARLPLP